MSVVKCKKMNLEKNGIKDPNLSWEAKGLLAYLLSYSKEDFYEANLEELVNATKDNVSQLKKILKELVAFNYCHHFQLLKNDKFIESYFWITDSPNTYNKKIIEEILSELKDTDYSYKLVHYVLENENDEKNRQTPEEIKYDIKDLILKTDFLNYYAGIPKESKQEFLDIIRDIPLSILKKNKRILSQMNLVDFKNHLLSLRRKYGE
ncbi:hypothetical protein [uncultured Fusobacterium sp.]|uniref:hypothetical protein n=1 Tax=uncultured Fusobacterium sp. TaxID=159267 RepID=UPI00265EB191|nr:hypothetical protein [uncultured Fusobacterium sp.]